MVKILLQILKKGTSALPIHPISFLCSTPVRHIERVPAGRVGAQDALEDAALHVKGRPTSHLGILIGPFHFCALETEAQMYPGGL